MGFWKSRKTLEAGERAPEFELPLLGGQRQSLKAILGGGPAVLAFFKVSCPVCQFTFPFLERLHQSAGPGKLQLVAISQDDARSTRDYNREYGVTFTTLLDEAGKGYVVSNAFGITTVPSLVLVEPDGSISMTSAGFSKKDIEALASRAGVTPFRPGEYVPEWQAG
jgi:peroxiredoxin